MDVISLHQQLQAHLQIIGMQTVKYNTVPRISTMHIATGTQGTYISSPSRSSSLTSDIDEKCRKAGGERPDSKYSYDAQKARRLLRSGRHRLVLSGINYVIGPILIRHVRTLLRLLATPSFPHTAAHSLFVPGSG